MSFYFFPTKYEKLKMEYLKKKMEQMVDIEELEQELMFLQQFIEPDISIRLGPGDLQYIAETSKSCINCWYPDLPSLTTCIFRTGKEAFFFIKNSITINILL